MIFINKFPLRACHARLGASISDLERWFLALCVGLFCLLALTWEARAGVDGSTDVDSDKSPSVDSSPTRMPGHLVEVFGRQMHIHCRGQWDGPTVILESGMGGFALDWFYVQNMLASTVRVCSYDRAGYAWSEASFSPRLSSQLAEELFELLRSDGLNPPYVLVGHSFGGYVVRNFAALAPEQVAGMVLVESSHPGQHDRLPDVNVREGHPRKNYPGPMVSVLDHAKLMSLLAKYPENIRPTMNILLSARRTLHTMRRESSTFSMSAQEVLQVTLPAELPLVVVSRGLQEWENTPLGIAREQTWQRMQVELTQLSRRSTHITARFSGHLVHLDEPVVVVDAICRVLAMAGWELPEANRHHGKVGCVDSDSGIIAGQD